MSKTPDRKHRSTRHEAGSTDTGRHARPKKPAEPPLAPATFPGGEISPTLRNRGTRPEFFSGILRSAKSPNLRIFYTPWLSYDNPHMQRKHNRSREVAQTLTCARTMASVRPMHVKTKGFLIICKNP